MLIITGVVLIAIGLLMGKLPGDIVVRGKNTTFYFPIVTCIVISLILSLVMWFVGRR